MSSVSAKVRTVVPQVILENGKIVVTIKNFNSKKDPFAAALTINGNTIPLETKLRAKNRRVDIFFPDLIDDETLKTHGLLTLSGKGNVEETPVLIFNELFVDSTGPQGDVGPAGPQGPAGPAGASGPSGSQGPKGNPGPSGPQGAQGPVGPMGEKGDSITDAMVNSDGVLVLKSSNGDVFVAGTVKGDAGPQGPQGPKGEDGDSGQDGAGFRKGEVVRLHNPTTVESASVATTDNVVINRLSVGGEYKGVWNGNDGDLATDPIQIYRDASQNNNTALIIEVGDDFGNSNLKDTLKIGAQEHQTDTFKSVMEIDSDSKIRIPSLAGGRAAGKVLTTDDEGNLILVSISGLGDSDDDDCVGNNGNDKPVGQGACNSNK